MLVPTRIWEDPILDDKKRFFENNYTSFFQPYEYIEAVNNRNWDPNFGDDYYFYNGDSFTPYTKLNSNYPGGFQIVPSIYEGARPDKIMVDLKDSGIYIEDIQIAGGKANFRVTIKDD